MCEGQQTKKIICRPSRLIQSLALVQWHHKYGHIVHRSFDNHISLGSSPSDGRGAICTPSTISRICREDAGVAIGWVVSCAASGGRLPARPREFKRIWRLPMLPTQRHVMRVSNGRRQARPPGGLGSRRADARDCEKRQHLDFLLLLDALDDRPNPNPVPSCHSSGEGVHSWGAATRVREGRKGATGKIETRSDNKCHNDPCLRLRGGDRFSRGSNAMLARKQILL